MYERFLMSDYRNQEQEETKETVPSFDIMEAAYCSEFSHYPEGVKLIVFDKKETDRPPVPILDARQEDQHEFIARYYSDYDQMGVVHGIGLFGAVWPVRSSGSTSVIERFKPDRPSWEKVPIYILPQDLSKIIDSNEIHDEFRPYFQDEQAIRALYNAAPAIHLVVPVQEHGTNINEIFITRPEDWNNKEVDKDEHIEAPTISAFYWDDPDHEHIAQKTKELLTDGHIAISSFNKRGEQPAWDFEGLLEYIKKNSCPFDYVVYDPLLDKISVGSSFVQIAPPLRGEDPLWKVYRTGPTAIGSYLERIGSSHDYRIVKGAKEAARRPELEGQDLDEAMLAARDAVLRVHNYKGDG